MTSDDDWSKPLAATPVVVDVAQRLQTNCYSRAFQTWQLADAEIARFVFGGWDLALRAHHAMFDAASVGATYDPENDDQGSAYWKHVDGLELDTHCWLMTAGGVQACVANFELYLQDFLYQVVDVAKLDRRPKGKSLPAQRDARTPDWLDLVNTYSQLGIELSGDDVTEARNLRHGLAHRLTEATVSEVGRHRPLAHFNTGGRDFAAGTHDHGAVLDPAVFQDRVREPLARSVCQIEDRREQLLKRKV